MSILFSFPGNEALARLLIDRAHFESGFLTAHNFPDGETLIRIDSDVTGKEVFLLCTLDRPDEKAMALMFFAKTARELGAGSIKLIAPYLGYMRQDIRFNRGEAVTSDIFAEFLSRYFDGLITVDPHLHRHKSMNDIYSIPAEVVHASGAVVHWIRNNVENPVLIGPDEESEQWVADIAGKSEAPYIVLKKIRHGDRDIEISMPMIEKYAYRTPVLVDDIISTANTMIRTVELLKDRSMPSPVCIGIHAVFAGDAYERLKSAGVKRIVTCNTIHHSSNEIDISGLLVCS